MHFLLIVFNFANCSASTMSVTTSIQVMLNVLREYVFLPGVQSLIATGEALLSSICSVIAAHPIVFLVGVAVLILVFFLPKIIDAVANWVMKLRIAMHKLGKAWSGPISGVEAAFGI